jgi:hypothetical protein
MVGCTSIYSEYCEEYTDCVDGNDMDRKACLQTISNEKKLAKIYDCSDDFQDYMECMMDDATCDNVGRYDYWTDRGDCRDDASDLVECISEASDYLQSYDTGSYYQYEYEGEEE